MIKANLQRVLSEKKTSLDLEICHQTWYQNKSKWLPSQTTTLERDLITYTTDLKMTAEMEAIMDNIGKKVHSQTLSYRDKLFDSARVVAILHKS